MKKKLLILLCVCSVILNAKADPRKFWDKSFWQNATVEDAKELVDICKSTNKTKKDRQKCYDDNLISLASDAQHTQAIEYLVKAGANVNAKKFENTLFPITPLNAALRGNPNAAIPAKLIKLGAKVTTEDFFTACGYTSNPKIIALLIKHGANVNKPNKSGYTPLMVAAQLNLHPKIIDELLKQGARLEDKDDIGYTALFWAVSMNKNPEIVDALLDAGADANATDRFGKKAIEAANGIIPNKNFLNSKTYQRLKQSTKSNKK